MGLKASKLLLSYLSFRKTLRLFVFLFIKSKVFLLIFKIIRRPSAKSLLESPYFPTTVRSSYLFLAPLQLLSKDGSRVRYAASFAKRGALKAMGAFAAEMCAPYCLALIVTPLSDVEAEWAYIILKEFLRCLNPEAVKTLVLPAIQKILQASCKLRCLMFGLGT